MNDWRQFENDVRDLLRLQGWKIEQEKQLGHKKIDAYGIKASEFLKTQKIAVECKHYEAQLSQAEITRIFANYLPLVQENLVDFILLVTVNGLTPSAQTYAQTIKGFIHITFDDLLYSSIDFAGYVQGMKSQYYESNLSGLYTAQPYKYDVQGTHLDLAENLLSWIHNTEEDRPIAILGGYGMGKSTLARRLAFLLAEDHLVNSRSRIPILIRLEEVVTDQSLEGLLGRHFTSLSVVPNYNFHTFMMLNSRGRFVILLDGFDEMKKTMSWETMRYNLEQLNRLVDSNAKVILLGRPTAFLNESEYNEALHGRRSILGADRAIPNHPDYREVYLLPFQPNQIKEYITKYSEVLKEERSIDFSEKQIGILLKLIAADKENQLSDLASRPVQLKMLLEILPYYRGEIEGLTTAILYTEFIDLVIRRELSKKARETFSIQARRQFAARLAFWMWRTDAGTEVIISSIPDSLFDEFRIQGVPLDSIKRDLLSGCFLESKPPEGFYFPHRSFLEFLVAERLVEMIGEKDPEVPQIQYISPEIKEFFLDIIGRRSVRLWVAWMRNLVGMETLGRFGLISLSRQLISLFLAACERHNLIVTDRFLTRLYGLDPYSSSQRPQRPQEFDQLDTRREKKPKKGKIKSPHRQTGVARKKDFKK